MKTLTLGIIGCGNMGSAIARGIASERVISPDKVFLYDKVTVNADALAKETGLCRGDLSQMVRGSDILLLAVKPQDFENLAKEIHADIVGQTIVSVMAGIRIDVIIGKMGKTVPVSRAMPNLAAIEGASMTCVAFNDRVSARDDIMGIFASIGEVMEVREDQMDMVTALSGSGPAYLFYLAESMIRAGVEMGMSEERAAKLVVQTLYGASVVARSSGLSPGELMKKVASKGGTTEAALSVLGKSADAVIREAIMRARDRSAELSGR